MIATIEIRTRPTAPCMEANHGASRAFLFDLPRQTSVARLNPDTGKKSDAEIPISTQQGLILTV